MGGSVSSEGFGSSTTAEEVINSSAVGPLTGKLAIVTGANTGIGIETARQLYRKGVRVIMACRSADKMETACKTIEAEFENTTGVGVLERMQLDLNSLKSVNNFAETFLNRKEKIDMLILNAGVMLTPLGKTEDGFETQIGTNHLAHFALTMKLLPALVGVEDARIIVVSSRAHKFGTINLEDLHWEKNPYSPAGSYGQSKLANILFAKELQKRLDAVGNKNITVVSLHPGDINTELGRYHIGAKIYYTLATPFLKSVPQGAATTIYCAVYPSVRGKGGEYFSDCQEGDHTEFAKDMEVAKKLFDMSEELTKTKIPADLFN